MSFKKSIKQLIEYVLQNFGVGISIFVNALKMSPGAKGSILGSISELLFKDYAESIGFEVYRIKEKPEGSYDAKSPDAKGDFYIRRENYKANFALVIECKSVKSNAEKRAGLIEKGKLLRFLQKHSFERKKSIESILKSGKRTHQREKEKWEKKNKKRSFPSFNWIESNPGPGIPDLSNVWEKIEDLEKWVSTFYDKDISEDSFWDLKAPVRLLQTHMPSTRIDPYTKLSKTGPLKHEFNILAVDLFLKTGKHQFIFANSSDLNHQGGSPNHLQQNYTVDILLECENFAPHTPLSPWYINLEECIKNTSPELREIDESQLDYRKN